MSAVRRLYLDTNIFIHAFEHKDTLSKRLIELLTVDNNSPVPVHVTSELTVAELVVGPFRNRDEALLRLYQDWTQTNPYIEVFSIRYAELWSAGALRSRYSGLKLPDAIHIATAMRGGCSHVLTADRRLSGIYELEYGWGGQAIGPLFVEVVRPEISIVDSLMESMRS